MPQPVFDASQPFEPAPEAAAPSAAPQFDPAQPFTRLTPGQTGAPTFDPAGSFSKLYTLDEFKAKPEAELDQDKEFHPVEFGQQNQEAIRTDPDALGKLVRLYQNRENRGTTLAEKGASLVKGVPTVVGAIGRGIKEAGKKLYDLNPIALAARAAGAASGAGVEGLKGEAKRVEGEVVEIPASVETAAVGTGDLVRRSARAIGEGVTGGKASMTPDEWRNRFFDDVAGLDQARKAGQGNGEVLRAFAADADTLKNEGIELRPEVIEDLSAITDPINFIPVGAAVGAVSKVAGRLSTRVLARTLTAAQAKELATVLNSARNAVASGAGKAVSAAGTAVEKVGETAEKGVRALGGTASGVGLGAILGGNVYSALGGAAVAKGVPRAVQAAGSAIRAGGEILSGTRQAGPLLSAAGRVGAEAAKGVGEGIALTLPFTIGARPEEEEALLGAAGLGGAVRGTMTAASIGSRAAGRAIQSKLADTLFRQVDQPEAPASGTYGTEPTLDTAHNAAFQGLDPRSQKLVNWTRETLRDSGVETYVLDEPAFAKQAGTGNARGYALDVGSTVAPDGTTKPLLRIFLNKGAEALPHELFHAFEALDPKGSKELIDSVQAEWTPEEKKSFGDLYNSLLNDGKPEASWTRRLDDTGLAQEAAAEVFSRIFLSQDLSGIAPSVQQKAAAFTAGLIEKLGAPLGGVGKAPGEAGVSTLGVRPGAKSFQVGQQWIQNLFGQIRERGNVLPESRAKNPLGPLTAADITSISAKTPVTPAPTPSAPVPVVPKTPAPTPAPAPAAPQNIRVSRGQQNDFASKRAAETGIDRAKVAAEKTADTNTIDRVNEISDSIEAGNPVLEIEHKGVINEEAQPTSRSGRRAEQEAAYIAEGLGAAPDSIRTAYQKTFVPVRWEVVAGKPQLLAMSLDKVIANVHRLVKDSATHKVESKIPYETVEGKLTDNAWGQVVDDIQSYVANQDAGYRGDGRKLTRPTEDVGLSIPAERADYNPVSLPEDRANFVNAVMALAPPLTAREVKGAGTPGNVKGQILAEINKRTPQKPTVISPENITKQQFKSQPGREVMETNPLRNELAAAGVPVRELIEVTERLRAGDIQKVTPRPDINFKAPVTDTIRGGFLPENGKFLPRTWEERRGYLSDSLDKTIEKLEGLEKAAREVRSKDYADVSQGVSVILEDLKKAREAAKNQESPKEAIGEIRLHSENSFRNGLTFASGREFEPGAKKILDSAVAEFHGAKELIRDVSGLRLNAEHVGLGAINAPKTLSFTEVRHLRANLQARFDLSLQEASFLANKLAKESGSIPSPSLEQDAHGVVNTGKLQAALDAFRKNQATDSAALRQFTDGKTLKELAPRGGKLLPGGREFYKQGTVEDIGKAVLDIATPEELSKQMQDIGGLTGGAFRLGANLSKVEDLATLRRFESEVTERIAKAKAAKDLEGLFPLVNKVQFFREAIQAAEGTAAPVMIEGILGKDYKAPFPKEEGKFLPRASDETIQNLAKDYAETLKLPYKGQQTYAPINADLSKRLADFYEQAKSDPTNLEVQKSYDALAKETLDQYKLIEAAGYKLEPWTGEGEPYKNSEEAVNDVRNNKHLYVLQTEGNFAGQADNPMLAASGVPGLTTVNDVFRGVHDFFGHAKEGYQFGPRGEFNAWRAHSEMFSPEAQGALAAETLAQNSWVNYGPKAEGKALKDRPFAQQKSVVVPKELIDEAQSQFEEGKFLPSDHFDQRLDPIKIAAIRTPDGRVFTGSWHGDAFDHLVQAVESGDYTLPEKAREAYRKDPYRLYDDDIKHIEDGFETISGKFLNRMEATDHAVEIGQISPDSESAKLGYLESDRFKGEQFEQIRENQAKAEMKAKAKEQYEQILASRKGKALPARKEDVEYVAEWNPTKTTLDVVAKRNGREVGRLQTYRTQENEAHVGNVFVQQDFRREGIGEALYRRAAQELKNEGVESLLGMAVSPGSQALRRKVFPDTTVDNVIEPEFGPRAEELRSKLLPGRKVKRDEQGRPLRTDGTVDFERWQKENLEEQKARKPANLEKYNAPIRRKSTSLTGWILPDQGFEPLNTLYHEEYLAKNAADLNERFGTDFDPKASEASRLDALNKGFIRIRAGHQAGGTLNVELNQRFFKNPTKKALEGFLVDRADNVDRMRISLLDDEGQQVATASANVVEQEGAERADALLSAVDSLQPRGKFLPGEQGLPGFTVEEENQQSRTVKKVSSQKKKFPEALPIQYVKDENGYVIKTDGKPRPIVRDYDFMDTPVARAAGKGLSGEKREAAVAAALGDRLAAVAKEAVKDPAIKAGEKWYSTARTRLRRLFGDDSKFFSELLGATSARTPVETNFRFALDAYNQFKTGAYDDILKKYRQGKKNWDQGDIQDFVKDTGATEPSRGQYLDWWVKQNDLSPTQSSGKKFGMNSRAVLRVLDGSWASEVQGPKTPNFAGNLSGETFEATIDVWAARMLHRLANEGNSKRWRILPENETGVTDSDFFLGQAAFRHAAEQLKMKPDSLQALLWFAEKDHWEKNGWTRSVGAEKSDFNSILANTEREPSGLLRTTTPQAEINFDEIQPRKK